MDKFLQQWTTLRDTFPTLFKFSLNLLAAFVILFSGLLIARWVGNRLRKSRIGGGHVDATLRPVLASLVFYIIAAMTLYAFLRKLGIDAASLLAVFGAAGLAIGLALKDTLGNIAAGVMLLVLRPMKVGEYIDTSGFAGTIEEIGLFSTSLKNLEGLYVYVPNGQVWNARLTNFTRHSERRLIIDIGVGYDTDLERAKSVLLDIMNDNSLVQRTPAIPECHVMSFGDSAIILSSRCWLPADNWLKNTSDIRIAMKKALDTQGIDIPFPQRDITIKSGPVQL